MMPVAIICGGLATRMYPLTKTLPKSLITVNGQPFIYWQLKLLKERGIREVVLCVGKMGEMIRDAVGDGSRFSLHVQYSFDGDQLLGTAGAIKKALPLLEEDFYILYGDSYLECDYTEVANTYKRAIGCLGLMTVFENANRYETSNVLFRNGAIIEYKKNACNNEMQHIDYGLGIMNAGVLTDVPQNEPTDLSLVYRDLLRRGSLAAYEVTGGRFYEVGSPGGLADLEEHLTVVHGKVKN